MKRLEAQIFERMETEFKSEAGPGQMRLSFLSERNFFGLDILPFAVEIAKVTMMIARKLAIDELHISESPLPLDDLDQIERARQNKSQRMDSLAQLLRVFGCGEFVSP